MICLVAQRKVKIYKQKKTFYKFFSKKNLLSTRHFHFTFSPYCFKIQRGQQMSLQKQLALQMHIICYGKCIRVFHVKYLIVGLSYKLFVLFQYLFEFILLEVYLCVDCKYQLQSLIFASFNLYIPFGSWKVWRKEREFQR